MISARQYQSTKASKAGDFMNSSDYKAPSRSHTYLLPIIIGAVVIAGIVITSVVTFGRGGKPTVTEDTARIVRSFTVGSAYTSAPRYTGVVHARTESDLGFRVSGKIIEKLVDRGERVKKGQALMRLDPTDLALASNAAQQAVDAARAEQERALPDAERLKKLLPARAASQQDYDRAVAAATASTARLKAAEAEARRAANELEYAVLKADADGVIMEVPADAGQVVAVGQVVVRLAHDGTREAVVNLPENALSTAKSATEAYLYTQPDHTFPVTLRELSAMADPVSRTFQARYTLEDDGKHAPLGATVTVVYKANSDNDQESYEVPLGALYDTGSGTKVWVINDADSTVSLRPVTVVHLGQETAAITGDLKSGERIVALGAHLLKPAEKIRVAAANQQEITQ
jgi:RND family efflux transporter MFP subunit